MEVILSAGVVIPESVDGKGGGKHMYCRNTLVFVQMS